MTNDALFDATVPVFRHYLDRINLMLSGLRGSDEYPLESRLPSGIFTAGENISIAQGFVFRTICPLVEVDLIEFSNQCVDVAGLLERNDQVAEFLRGLDSTDFSIGEHQRILHTAGQADLDQTPLDFATPFGLPNFFFHYTMGYAALQNHSVVLGKSDFDGLHFYPEGFAFADT